jgi:hypothetical protein
MIIENGYIQECIVSGGGIDSQGLPVEVEETWGEPIPCNIRKSKSDKKGVYVDGHFEQCSAVILIDPKDFSALRIKVTDNREQVLGEFEVQDVQYLHAVDALQITV